METDDFVVKRLPAKYRAFAVVAASIVIQFSIGLVYTFGNIMPYLVSYLRWKVNPLQSRGSVLWLQSLMIGLPFSMLMGGIIEKKVGAKIGTLIGCTLYTGTIFLSYFTIQWSLLWLILSLGLGSSMGMGITYNCVLIQCQRWMPKRIGLASGLVAGGFGSGAVFLSPLQTKFINPYNLSPNSNSKDFTQVELLNRVPEMFLMLGSIFGTLQFIALFFIAEPKVSKKSSENEQSLLNVEKINGNTENTNNKTKSQTNVKVSSALKSTTFYSIAATFLLCGIWVLTISGFYKEFGRSFIKDDFFLSLIISFAALVNCVSRVGWGLIADRLSYQTAMLSATSFGTIMMPLLFLIRYISSLVLYFIAVSLMFACVGSTFTLIPYSVHKCFGSQNFGLLYGFAQLGLSTSGFISALVSQFLLQYLGLEFMFIFGSASMFLAFLITLIIPITKYGNPLSFLAKKNIKKEQSNPKNKLAINETVEEQNNF